MRARETGLNSFWRSHIFPAEVFAVNEMASCATNETALRAYRQVADLVQQGQTDAARKLAVTIPIDHLRGLALLLVNYSRRL